MSSLTPRINRLENLARKNPVINGAHDYFQEYPNGLSGIDNTNTFPLYIPDMFAIDEAGGFYSDGYVTEGNPITAPLIVGGEALVAKKAFRHEITTAGTQDTTNHQWLYVHKFENNFIETLDTKKLFFKIRASRAGNYRVYLIDQTGSKTSPTDQITYTIDQADVWEQKELEVDLSSLIRVDTEQNNEAFAIAWEFCQKGNTFFTHLPQAIGDYFEITEVALFDGGLDSGSFSRAGRDVAEELQLCQRYFEKSYELDTGIASITEVGSFEVRSLGSSSFGYTFSMWEYSSIKRDIPIVNIYATATGNIGKLSDAGTDRDALATSIGTRSCYMRNNQATSGSNFCNWHATANARL